MKLAKKLSIAAAGMALGFASVSVPSSAQAAQLFNFSYVFSDYSGAPVYAPTISGSGTLTTTDLNPVNNSYTITGITGTRTYGGVQKNILGLLQPGAYAGNDNLLYANAPFLTGNGFSFKVDGDIRVNIYRGSSNYYVDFSQGGMINRSLSFNVTPVPEPTTIAGSLAVGAGLVMSRLKKRKLEQAS